MQTKGFVRVFTLLIFGGSILIAPLFLMGMQSTVLANSQLLEENTPMEIEVVLKGIYLDGEISEETVTEKVYLLENFWAKYDEWQFIGMENNKFVLQKQMNDISPLLKANGYFGVTEDGTLSIFNGKPYKSHIIQSFFQIDVGKLESHIKEELMNGIPIKTKDRYVEVLETFKTYSKEIEAN